MPQSLNVTNPDRLSLLDTELLELEDKSHLHAHVASVLIFAGPAPTLDELTEEIVSHLDEVPRYRQKLAEVPYRQGRPVWIDDPFFNPGYHIRHAALPRPGDEPALARLAGRLFSQRLDRTKPLWEMWLVEGVQGDRFALIGKTHHVLVDGIADLDLTTVLFDRESAAAAPTGPPPIWSARPAPSRAELLAGALLERASDPGEAATGVQELLRRPRALADELRHRLAAIGPLSWLAGDPAPRTPLNVAIGPHRRYTWIDGDLERFRQIKTALGGSVNDVVLTAVAGALGRYLRGAGHETEGLVLRAIVPVWAPADVGRSRSRVETVWAPLPVGIVDPRERFAEVSQAMDGLKESGRAVDARILTELAGFAPSTIISEAARVQARSRFANLTVTNVPGPQGALFLLGRRLEAIYPVFPLADHQALGVAVMSYCGRLGFGLLADYDAVPDVEAIAVELEAAIDELSALAGSARRPGRGRRADGRAAPAAAPPRPRGARRPRTAAGGDRV
ncbi:MAG: diacylglycerol O-acyltransferase / wax synthase [Solirubrobacteraceae bacterium]|jgi:WS/DGAT/MGAT family acyltransferase|nr:diacylglycerol O-acyltransferase / wax synthase [Solirubrobacteraceae bacterium]